MYSYRCLRRRQDQRSGKLPRPSSSSMQIRGCLPRSHGVHDDRILGKLPRSYHMPLTRRRGLRCGVSDRGLSSMVAAASKGTGKSLRPQVQTYRGQPPWESTSMLCSACQARPPSCNESCCALLKAYNCRRKPPGRFDMASEKAILLIAEGVKE